MSDSLHAEAADWAGCTLAELCQRIALDEHFVVQCIEHGIIDTGPPDAIFTATTVLRITKAWRLHRDLDIHISHLALILELLDERDLLRQEAAVLRQRLQQWEGEY